VVALLIVFIGAVAGFPEPLNAVQLLWVNLVMDTMGALALGTEAPVPALLERKPYKRNASLVSRPMWRNIICQSFYQVVLLLTLIFNGSEMFNVPHGIACERFHVKQSKTTLWDPSTTKKVPDSSTAANLVDCSTYADRCGSDGTLCLENDRKFLTTANDGSTVVRKFSDFNGYDSACLTCEKNSYVHGSIIFNTFIFAQVFNEYNARKIFDELNMLEGMNGNWIFLAVSIVTILCQLFLIEVGGDFVKTSPLTLSQWFITIGLGALAIPVGILMRFIPVVEDPDSFFTAYSASAAHAVAAVVPAGGEKYGAVKNVEDDQQKQQA
jgi:magnesium-transporting ATPase (P-type)